MSSFSLPTTCALLLYSFVLLLPLTASRENNFTLQSFQEGRIFYLSSDAPMTKELAKLQPVVDAADLILTHVERVENAIISSLSTGRSPAANDDIRPCNHKEPGFGRGARNKMGARGWPAPAIDCVTDVFGTELTQAELPKPRIPLYTVDDLYDAIFIRGKVIKDNILSITSKVINNFTNPDIIWNCPYNTPSQRCVLHPVSAFRIDQKWYLTHRITNEAKNRNLPLLGRSSVVEFPRVVNGALGDNKLMCLPVRPPDNGEESEQEHTFITNTTTLIQSVRGVANPSFINVVSIDENTAILRSLDQSDLFVQQAEDALTASSIAILFLPLALNLVPIALLAEVSSITMLLYTLMSDVLTVVPLGIKGGELISIGSQRHRTILVRITGDSNGRRAESAAAEIMAAECRAHEDILPIGVVFLALSIIFLVGGIIAEFVARRYTMKKRLHLLEELKEVSLELTSGGNSRIASVSSREASQPPSLSSIDIQARGVGSPFRSTSYNDSYKGTKRDKNA